MRGYSLSSVSDSELTLGMHSLAKQDRVTTAMLLAHIAEFDDRRLYLPAAYPSMHAYCVGELKLSEDAAYKRIQAARVARRFPVMFEALEDGWLNLTSACLLAPSLKASNCDDLLSAAAGRTNQEVREMIATRFPRSETLPLVVNLPDPLDASALIHDAEGTAPCAAATCDAQLAAQQVETSGGHGADATSQPAERRVGTRSKVSPTAHDRYALHLSIGRTTRDKLEHARNLLGHALPAGDLAQVVDRALDALIEKLERRKFAATRRARRSRRPSAGSRHIPALVKRTVWERDGGQCTFVSAAGRRCKARNLLEFDHATPAARGGPATTGNLRLRCRAHNQYEAERAYGPGFMHDKREAARERKLARPASRARAEREARVVNELVAPLRILGFSDGEARRAARLCREIPEASLEMRLRRALFHLRPRAATVPSPAAGS